MKRKNQTKNPNQSTRVFQYGCLPAIDSQPIVENQFFLAHRYRNTLCDLERKRRARWQEVMQGDPQYLLLVQEKIGLEQQLEALRSTIKNTRSKARKRVPTAPTDTAQALLLKQALKQVKEQIKALRPEVQKSQKIALEGLQAESNLLQKTARSETQVYWGTYLLVEAAAEMWRKHPTPPKFIPGSQGRSHGRLGVQLQKGIPWADMQVPNTLAYITLVPHRGKIPHALLHLRIDSTDTGKPVWATFPFILHREPPKDAVVKWVVLLRNRIGLHDHYEVQFTVTLPVATPTVNAQLPRAAIDIGWRQLDNTIRFGYLASEAGDTEDLRLPAPPSGVMNDSLRVDNLEGIRKIHFNDVLAWTSWWVKNTPLTLSEWLEKDKPYIHLWKSPQRLYRLFLHWRKNRIPQDTLIFDLLSAWGKKERHLYEWESNARRKSQARRDDTFRQLADRLSTTYREIVIEDLKIPSLTKTPEAESNGGGSRQGRRQAKDAAPGRFRLFLKQACLKTGCKLVAVPPAYTSRMCNACQNILEKSSDQIRTCTTCNRTWDRDRNAAMNLLLPEGVIRDAVSSSKTSKSSASNPEMTTSP